ncbi:unnamed protein product [Effrenium voratum]|nr:unnamed protein product [Effrenium voratum]
MDGAPEEHDESARALAAECAKQWPTMLARKAPAASSPAAKAPAGDGEMAPAAEVNEADTHTIKVDVLRTRGNHPAFGPTMRERLRSLLTEFCHKEQVRYMQGLHEVAAVFAYIESASGFDGSEKSEDATLACFTAFVRTFMPCFYDGESFVILHITLLFFRQLLLYHLPHLHNQLEEMGVAPVVYATPWFITLFAHKTPLHVVMRLWHEYIRRGDPTFVPFLAVATMELEKQAFLDAEEDDFRNAVDRTKITSLEKLQAVWKAAENLYTRTPKSFTFRMSKVLTQVRQQLQEKTNTNWTQSVLARADQERRLALLAREAVAQHARVSSEVAAVPAPNLPPLRVLLLDVRPKAAFDAEHLPQALHFYPPCLQRLALVSSGSQRAERLAAALKQAMAEVGDLVLRKDSKPQLASPSNAEHAALGAEVFQALQGAASEAWGEAWLSESQASHLAILGGEADWDAAQLCKANGAVAALFELLTEQLCMPRVSVVLGGAQALHREAEKRGLKVMTSESSSPYGNDKLRTFLSGGAKAFASFRDRAKANFASDA